MDEKTYFEQGNVSVTTNRLIIRDTTYFINNITSVTIKATNTGRRRVRNKRRAILFLIVILVAVTLFLVWPPDADLVATSRPFLNGVLDVLVFVAVLMGLVAFILLLLLIEVSPEYHLVISSSAGEKDVLTLDDADTIRQLAKAINQAQADR
jgi:RsiW-degrading membrane proteinase PrsW (M82 family)